MDRMEEEFKNNIRQKANDFEIAPDVDWGTIEQRLDNLDKNKIRRLKPVFYIAAAAIALLLVVSGLFWMGDNNNSNPLVVGGMQDSIQVINDKDSVKTEQDIVIDKGIDKDNYVVDLDKPYQIEVKDKPIRENIIKTTYVSAASDSIVNNSRDENDIKRDSAFTLKEEPVLVAESVNTDKETDVKKEKKGEDLFQQNQLESPIKLLSNNNQAESFSLGLLFASNATTTSSPNSGNSILSTPGYGTAHKQFLVDNLATSNNYDNTNHNLPLTFGVSAQKNINSRFAIKSGVTYSYLQSTFSFTRSNIKKTQSLHYIGIPLSGVVNVKNFGRFSVYLSAGGMVEKNIAGNTSVSSSGGKTDKDKFTINQLQWSVNAHAGLNYRFYKKLALYVEPGWAYHFDDGSGINTYRTKHPSSFNFQAGFRFGF